MKRTIVNTTTQSLMNLLRFSHETTKRMDANLSIHGISLSEYQVLHHLSCSAASTLPRVELARLVGLTASGVTRMLAPMEKIGLVGKESHPRDARLSLVKLTKAGANLYQDASQTVGQVADSIVGSLTKAQQEALGRLSASVQPSV